MPQRVFSERRNIARYFARDCATLMNARLEGLPDAGRRALARRHSFRCLADTLLQNPNDWRCAALAEDPDFIWPNLPKTYEELRDLRSHLLRHVVPRLTPGVEFYAGEDELVVLERATPLRAVRDSSRVRAASPYRFRETTGRRVRCDPKWLFSRDPELAVEALFHELPHNWPWAVCEVETCRRIFAAGRAGARFCCKACRGAAAHARRQADLKRLESSSDPKHRKKAHRLRKQNSDRVSEFRKAKERGTWEPKRAAGAGRRRKTRN